ncbi:unnamed protein product (macronuclear) [Paramecium tetraurelia]|uniref:Uncharacterized protein n=1 Tax=Paramecium tetraurelia TaxID=5888 RepID=A0DL04_PARTE|nr:uncharacterized protein GSPATT00018038001 [Paramecium tetraurelia]CAK83721.1 unnamed protein product [Paramecium tetraurelia]|eukprot:XP_001451118.1 hypothetical protein (macronuclear) [Paramecium tetraurelia strain d4-2]
MQKVIAYFHMWIIAYSKSISINRYQQAFQSSISFSKIIYCMYNRLYYYMSSSLTVFLHYLIIKSQVLPFSPKIKPFTTPSTTSLLTKQPPRTPTMQGRDFFNVLNVQFNFTISKEVNVCNHCGVIVRGLGQNLDLQHLEF